MLASINVRSNTKFINTLLDGDQMSVAGPVVKSVLTKLAANEILMARFLNTFSYMEFIGAMTLPRSFMNDEISDHALRHLLEENDHARLFRVHGEKLANRQLTYKTEDLFARPASRNYIYRTATYLRKNLRGSNISSNITGVVSQYCSLVAEMRTAWLYPQMEMVLKENTRVSIAKIIRDESGHIYYLNSILSELDPDYQKRCAATLAVESEAFLRFMNKVNDELQGALGCT